MRLRDIPLAARFWSRVDKRGPDECWEWTGSKHRQGYGRIGANGNRSAFAHRVSWELQHGPIKSGLKVLHACDNTGCVNPAHMRLGTQSENMADMQARKRRLGKRGSYGAGHGQAKLTEEAASAILRGSEPLLEAANKYGVGISTVSQIRSGKTWKHLSENPNGAQ